MIKVILIDLTILFIF